MALKENMESNWVHSICVQYTPEQYYDGIYPYECVFKVNETIIKRKILQCTQCRIPNGAPIQCHFRTCYTAFHAYCGFQANFWARDKMLRTVQRRDRSILPLTTKTKNIRISPQLSSDDTATTTPNTTDCEDVYGSIDTINTDDISSTVEQRLRPRNETSTTYRQCISSVQQQQQYEQTRTSISYVMYCPYHEPVHWYNDIDYKKTYTLSYSSKKSSTQYKYKHIFVQYPVQGSNRISIRLPCATILRRSYSKLNIRPFTATNEHCVLVYPVPKSNLRMRGG